MWPCTPRGWDRRGPGERRPTLYLLAGGDGDHTTWTAKFRVQELAELRDVLVVMPGMPLFGFWTDWGNHGRQGSPRVRTDFLREVVPLVEREYGAGTRRAVAGESQGASAPWERLPGPRHVQRGRRVRITRAPGPAPRDVAVGAKFVGVDGYAVFGDPWERYW
ncbi:hypothetical protein [Streptomyces sp. NPDC008137]|uniref:hypothetical protein n=1 Tax=Streptomyces sp. NPDC008137 TaxID=3364813 RepID=UPI0036E71FF2